MKVLDLMEGEKKLFLSIFTNDCADHNITHIFVQCCLLALFRIADLDILNVGRCAPYHSYTNPAERCTALLNLEGVSLERDDAGCFEIQISSYKSMNGIRQAAPKVLGLKEAFQASVVEAPRNTLENVFSCLELKGKQRAARDPDLIVNARSNH